MPSKTVTVEVDVDLFDIYQQYESYEEFVREVFDFIHDLDNIDVDVEMLQNLVTWIFMEDPQALRDWIDEKPHVREKLQSAFDAMQKGMNDVQSSEPSSSR